MYAPLKRLIAPVGCLVVSALLAGLVDGLILQDGSAFLQGCIVLARYATGIGLWLTLAWLCIRLLDTLVWPLLVERRVGHVMPRLLKDLGRVVVGVMATGLIVSEVFEMSITGFVAASGVVGLVLGLALRSTIADFFSGIALSLERSFTIGDYIQLETGGAGEVIEMNWRTTVLKNLSGNYCTIPNSKISAMQVENFSQPENTYRMLHYITLDFAVPIARAERILAAAVAQAQVAIGGYATPQACVHEITERGVQYVVVYGVPGWPQRGLARAEVMRNIMHHLTVAGIRPIHPQYEIYTGDMSLRQGERLPNSPHMLLRQIPLLHILDDTEIAALAGRVQGQLHRAGSVIVEQGSSGASMYIVAEGMLSVYVAQTTSANAIQVNHHGPGEFFGEISLLTGEPRSATVKAEVDSLVYEITKEDMELLLDKRPEIAEQLTQMVARHRLRTTEAIQTLTAAQQEVAVQHLATQLLRKVGHFFHALRHTATASGPEGNASGGPLATLRRLDAWPPGPYDM